MDLIFCAGRTRRYAEIALACGFLYGCRSDYRPLFPVAFADIDWKRADWRRHKSFVMEHRPQYAVAPDITEDELLLPVLRYAYRLASFAQTVIVVPKVRGIVDCIPDEPWLRLGYSVPTNYGAAPKGVLLEFGNRPTHLLGGSIKRQLLYAQALNVQSVDGNAHMKAAAWGSYWDGETWASKGRALRPGPSMNYKAFALSCANILASWDELEREMR